MATTKSDVGIVRATTSFAYALLRGQVLALFTPVYEPYPVTMALTHSGDAPPCGPAVGINLQLTGSGRS